MPTLKRKPGNPRTRRHFWYKDVICTFDIETTALDGTVAPEFEEQPQSILYLWAFHFHHYKTYVGRTWEELAQLFHKIEAELQTEERLCIYIHNLSYEHQFLRTIYDFAPDEVFCLDSRKILKETMADAFELRDSYRLSGKSLDKWAKDLDVEHKKLSGEEFDYSKKRYPWTPLTEREKLYQLHDVWALAECVETQMQAQGDDLYTIPMTATGYVRRDAKKAMARCDQKWLRRIQPDMELYTLAKEAFRGGNTHANRFFAGKIIPEVHSADRSSSYPDVQCNDQFPISKFYKLPDDVDMNYIEDMVMHRNKAAIFRLRMYNVRLRDPFCPVPYLSSAKCRCILHGAFDNGRVLSADYLETTITDVDFRIIISMYDADDMEPFDAYYACYGSLPRPLTDLTKEYYRRKTQLKGVEGMELEYLFSKGNLNAIYGMSAQDICKTTILFQDGEYVEDDTPPELTLKKSTDRAFQSFMWGCWVTAWARYWLQRAIDMCGPGGHDLVYVDTDSVKYRGFVDWSPLNDELQRRSLESGSYAADPSGEVHFMGVYEQEKTAAQFATLGAKKYYYTETVDGPCKVTISGVVKRKGGPELDRYGGIHRFVQLLPPFTFRDAGGVEAIYNDNPPFDQFEIDGHKVTIGPNVVIRDSTYTLSITSEYSNLIEDCNFLLDKGVIDMLP